MAVDLDRVMSRLNTAIVWLLRSRLHALVDSGLMLVTVTGRRTGKQYTIPVGYQRHGEHIAVLVSKARRKKWWRNYTDTGPVEVLLAGKTAKGTARVIAAGSDAFYATLQQSFDRMPWLGGQFGIRYTRSSGLTGDQRRVLARDAAVVRIELPAERKQRSNPAARAERAAQ